MNMKAVLLVLSCLLIAVQGRSLLSTDNKPDTPPYEVKNATKALEIRHYENATWAVAFGRSRWSVDFAAQSAGLALAGYFKGANVDHTPIKPTVPVVGTVLRPHHPHHKNGSHHGNKTHPKPPHKPHGPPGPPAVALAAYIPAKYEGKAPLPDSDRVKIVKVGSEEVYVHKFGGWAISWVVKHEIGHLAKILKDLKICPKKGMFAVATYDLSPFKIFGRHNEIMWVKRHKHHNDSSVEGQADFDTAGMRGFEAFDAESLFPEEFPPAEAPGADLPAVESAAEVATGTETVQPWTLLQDYFSINEIEASGGDVQTA